MYLSGHLHRFPLPIVSNEMFGRHKSGTIELELADFKTTSRYRIIAVDGDSFAVADVHVNQWPALVVLAPKDARLLSPFEQRRGVDAGIRVLAFTSRGHNVTTVTATIDDGAAIKLHAQPRPKGACSLTLGSFLTFPYSRAPPSTSYVGSIGKLFVPLFLLVDVLALICLCCDTAQMTLPLCGTRQRLFTRCGHLKMRSCPRWPRGCTN